MPDDIVIDVVEPTMSSADAHTANITGSLTSVSGAIIQDGFYYALS